MRYSKFRYSSGRKYETPIFIDDRTQQDINLKTPKGYLNATDLNRIEYRTGELLEVLYALGYDTLHIMVQPTWARESIPYQSKMDGIRVHVDMIVKDYRHSIGQPVIPATLRRLTFQDINALEKSLRLLDRNLKAVGAQWHQSSGVTIAGEGVNL